MGAGAAAVPQSTRLNYSIQPASNNVIEISETLNPDDLSIVNIRIAGKNGPASPGGIAEGNGAAVTLDHINIVISSPGGPPATIATAGEGVSLTRSPRSITPVSGQFNTWTFTFDAARGPSGAAGAANTPNVIQSVFRAAPMPGVPGSGSIQANDEIVFTLRDVEVINQTGETDIVIEEFFSAESKQPDATHTLTITKIFPALAITSFTTTPSVIVAGASITLNWVTKGAATVSLDVGPDEDPGLPTPLIEDSDHVGSKVLHPKTTTTYTLRASRADTPVISKQVTVTVTDLTLIHGDLQVKTIPKSLTGGSVAAETLTLGSTWRAQLDDDKNLSIVADKSRLILQKDNPLDTILDPAGTSILNKVGIFGLQNLKIRRIKTNLEISIAGANVLQAGACVSDAFDYDGGFTVVFVSGVVGVGLPKGMVFMTVTLKVFLVEANAFLTGTKTLASSFTPLVPDVLTFGIDGSGSYAFSTILASQGQTDPESAMAMNSGQKRLVVQPFLPTPDDLTRHGAQDPSQAVIRLLNGEGLVKATGLELARPERVP